MNELDEIRLLQDGAAANFVFLVASPILMPSFSAYGQALTVFGLVASVVVYWYLLRLLREEEELTAENPLRSECAMCRAGGERCDSFSAEVSRDKVL